MNFPLRNRLKITKTGDTLHGTDREGKVSFSVRSNAFRISVLEKKLLPGEKLSLRMLASFKPDNAKTIEYRLNGEDLRLYLFYNHFVSSRNLDKAKEKIIIRISKD